HALGGTLDGRATELTEIGASMHELGERVNATGVQIVERATRVADTGQELIRVLPTLERAIEMATPLEGAIDRIGRLIDRMPGRVPRNRGGTGPPGENPASPPPGRPPSPPPPPPRWPPRTP
ncbi:MAG TPA: hypothetical protein VGX45_05255, partial [Solirubrobacteraceae bacterium]|nr:hypothetical protein [Solirubrobacteraceae bacterium]